MAITFSCHCGKQIKVADKFAGRRAKCPACGGAVTIPQPDASDIDADLVYEALGAQADRESEPAAGATCSACDKPMQEGAVFCTHCGYNRLSQTYVKSAKAYEADEKEPKAPLLVLAGIELNWWKLAVIVIPVIAIPVWYFTGPARDVHVLDVQTVNIVESINAGETREPFNLLTQEGDMSLGIKAVQSKSNPHPMIGGLEETYSLGSNDALVVTRPDESGDHIELEVALKQGAIRDMGRTSMYDSIIDGGDFKLVPIDGGTPLDARLLYHRFDSGAELDLGGADTTNYRTLFPSEPTGLDVDKESGTISGKAYWDQPHAKGQITFASSYSDGDYPAAKGLNANGKVTLTNNAGTTVNMDYAGGSLNIDWDPGATGHWSKRRYDHYSQFSPWHRYHFGLLFKRPEDGGKYKLTYCDKPVATVLIDPAPPPKTPSVSPVKRAKAKNKAAAPSSSSNNPLEYFDVLVAGRQQARGIVSASNMRQIGLGLQIYLDQNGQVWPDRLDQLRNVLSGYELVMVNPRTGDNPGFIYIRPEPGAEPTTTAVLFESSQGKPDPNGAVLYADGHIE